MLRTKAPDTWPRPESALRKEDTSVYRMCTVSWDEHSSLASSFNPYNNDTMSVLLLFPFNRWWNLDSQRLSNLSEVMTLINVRVEMWTQATDSRVHSLKIYMQSNVHSSTIYNSQDMELCKYPSRDARKKKTCYIYTMGYPQPLKKNEMMPCAATRTDLQMITPSEASQKQKDIHHMTSLTQDSEELICRAETDTENKLRLPKGNSEWKW